MPVASRSLICAVTAAALLVSGCVGVATPGTTRYVDLDSPAIRHLPVASMTEMERDVRLETGSRKGDKVTPPLFYTGIGLGTIGAVGGIAFGVAGFVTKNQLNDAYEGNSGLTVAEHERLVSNGELYNTLAISFSALAVLGYSLAIVTYGVDWNRCGPLVEKRRTCLDRQRKNK